MSHHKMYILLVKDEAASFVTSSIPTIYKQTNLNKPSSKLKLFKK